LSCLFKHAPGFETKVFSFLLLERQNSLYK